MRRIRIVVVIVAVFSSLVVFSQDSVVHRGLRKENFFVGGNFGLTFGRYTLINVSPQLGYRFNKYVAAGVGLNLLYISDKEKDLYGNDYRKVVQGVTGINLFGRVYPLQYLMFQVQPEANYIFGKQIFYQPTRETYNLDAEIVPSLLMGGGFVMPSERASLIISLMYDVLQDKNSPYGTKPVVNVGYNFNLR
ncbi:MAG: hypothetical protein ACM3VS_02770 [Candidatus Dadabacteria bacterium]